MLVSDLLPVIDIFRSSNPDCPQIIIDTQTWYGRDYQAPLPSGTFGGVYLFCGGVDLRGTKTNRNNATIWYIGKSKHNGKTTNIAKRVWGHLGRRGDGKFNPSDLTSMPHADAWSKYGGNIDQRVLREVRLGNFLVISIAIHRNDDKRDWSSLLESALLHHHIEMTGSRPPLNMQSAHSNQKGKT